MDLLQPVNYVLSFFLKSLVVITTLGLLVFIHELGHYLAARLFGVKVLEFSFGMGKILTSWQRNDTSYQIRAVPMGGFVKMAGEEGISDDAYIPKDDEFFGVSPFKRIGIVFAGPFMNIILTIFCFWMAIFFMGEDLTKPIVGYIQKDSEAVSQLQPGDTIISLDGRTITSFEELMEEVRERKNQNVDLLVLREGKKIDLKLNIKSESGTDLLGQEVSYGSLGISPYMKPLIGTVLEDSPADRGGLKEGDLIVEINNQKVDFWDEISLIINKNKDEKCSVTVRREGKEELLYVVPEKTEHDRLILGVSLKADEQMIFHRDLTIFKSFINSLEKIMQNTFFTYKAIYIMFKGGVSRDSLMGPVRLAGMVSSFADHGFFPWLILLGFISHQLAIINFLPFPALDGGHAVFYLTEIIRRKPLKYKTQEKINRFGFAFLISLFIFVVINDITSLIGK